jgi:hypothetical protein
MARHIVPMLIDRIVDELKRICITELAHKDPTRMTDIKAGRYQADPNTTELRASVQGGDLDDPNMLDGIVDLDRSPNRVGFNIDAREIGGTQMWYRKGTVRIELFFIIEGLEEDVARERAYTILGRIQGNIEKINVADLYDDFGEHAIKLFHTQNTMFQSGGPPASFLYRGKVIWECLTERDWS